MTKTEAKRVIELVTEQIDNREDLVKKVLEIVDMIDESNQIPTYPNTTPYPKVYPDNWPNVTWGNLCRKWDEAPGEHYPRDCYGGYTFYCNANNGNEATCKADSK